MREALVAHLPALRRYAHGLTGNRAEAEDLLQATLIRALEGAAGWRGGSLRAFLYTIMTNLFRNGLRARRRRPLVLPLSAGMQVAAPRAEPDPLLASRLAQALEGLDAERRAVLILVVVEGCSYGEVAAILKLPIGTVMSRLARARRQLARKLEDEAVVYLDSRRGGRDG